MVSDPGPRSGRRDLRRYPDREVRDFRGAALLPGLVNVHSHLELTLLRGYLENSSLWDWIRRVTQTKYELLTREDLRISALAGACEAIRAGITTWETPWTWAPVGMPSPTGGLRGNSLSGSLFTQAGGSRGSPDGPGGEIGKPGGTDRTAAGRRNRSARDRPGSFAPCSLQRERASVSDGPAVGRLQKPAGVHSSGRVGEESLLIEQGTGPMAEALRSRGIQWVAPGCSPVQYLHRMGVLAAGTLLVHCVRLQAGDLLS